VTSHTQHFGILKTSGFGREVGFSHVAYFGSLNNMEAQDLPISETGILGEFQGIQIHELGTIQESENFVNKYSHTVTTNARILFTRGKKCSEV
jgi:hypothetical protein